MLRFVICDDNREASERLEVMLRNNSDTELDIVCTSDRETTNSALSEQTDALFMDICLNDDNGIDYTAQLRERFPELKIVFISAYTEYCERIFLVQPTGFLIKPFKVESVRAIMKLITDSLQKGEKRLILRVSKNSAEQIDLSGVYYIENCGRKLYLFGENGTILSETRLRMSELERLMPDHIIRCHYSFFVNLGYVGSIKRFSFTLRDGREIPISQSRFTQSRDKYFHYLEEML